MDMTSIENRGAELLKEKLAPKEEAAAAEAEEAPEAEEAAESEAEAGSEEAAEAEGAAEGDDAERGALSEREQALLKEIARLKKGRREESADVRLGEIAPTTEGEEAEDVTPAEARLFTAWRDEALEELVEKYPQYKTSPKLWSQFQREYADRVPELAWAKKNGVPVSKSLFRERLMRVHKAVQDETETAREAGKKDLLKAQSAAAAMAAGSAKSSTPGTGKPLPKKNMLRPSKGGLEAWITK